VSHRVLLEENKQGTPFPFSLSKTQVLPRAWNLLAANNSSFLALNVSHQSRCSTHRGLPSVPSIVPLQGTNSLKIPLF